MTNDRYQGSQNGIDTNMGKSPLSPLCQRGVIPPFGKGRVGGILFMNGVIIMKLLISEVAYDNSIRSP